jgi:hypothetical protein
MDAKTLLAMRIQTLLQEVWRSEQAINADQLDATLRRRVQARFSHRFNQQRKALKQLETELATGVPLDTCWATLRGIEDACQSLFRECLAIVQGLLVRGASLDNGLCEIGDALLQDLGHGADLHWGRFTILAESESIVELGSIVRLRFPEVSIWSLPVAAHEYGHFVGPRLEVQDPGQPSRHPFQDFLEQIREDDPRYYYYGHEFFADLFATYALGPSFACCCILLRFDPVTASTEYSTHPSAAQRVYWLLSVLRAMDEQDPFLSFSGIIKDLENWWSATLAASGQSAGSLVSPDASSRLDSWRDELFAMVEDHLPPGTRYGGWPQAMRLAADWTPGEDWVPQLAPEDTIADILNAAWLCRTREGGNTDHAVRQIGDMADALCRQVGG